jgi:hypothetical protein
MQLKQAKEYFSLGIITGFEISRVAMRGDAWTLIVSGKEGRTWMLETQLGKTREFASLDTAAGVVEDIAGRLTSLIVRT